MSKNKSTPTKILSIGLILGTILSFSISSLASAQSVTTCAGFSDIPASDLDCKAFEWLKENKIMTGYQDSTGKPVFGTADLLLRDQSAKMVLTTFQKFQENQDYCQGKNPFPDINKDSWSFQYICQGKALNVIKGYDAGPFKGLYKPDNFVNRAELTALFARNLTDPMPVVPGSTNWYDGYLKYAENNNLFTARQQNLMELLPTDFMTRRDAAVLIFALYNLNKLPIKKV